MRRSLTAAVFLGVITLACRSQALEDPKTLYKVDTAGTTTALKPGEAGKLVLAITPTRAGAHVKAETPFKGKLSATGPVTFDKTEIAYKDSARVVNEGPVFEIPFKAAAAGASELSADLTFFVCTAEACLRTTELVKVPVTVK